MAHNEQFLLFPQCFVLNQINVSPFHHTFDIISLFAAELEKPKIGISGKGLSMSHRSCNSAIQPLPNKQKNPTSPNWKRLETKQSVRLTCWDISFKRLKTMKKKMLLSVFSQFTPVLKIPQTCPRINMTFVDYPCNYREKRRCLILVFAI